MNKTLILSSAVMVLFAQTAAFAETSANVALTSNYIWRGQTLSDNDAALQGGFDFQNDNGFYSGVWGSSVASEAVEHSGLELDVYVGFTGTTARAAIWDLGFIAYTYPGTDKNTTADAYEVYGGLQGDVWNGYAWYDWDNDRAYADINGAWDLQEDAIFTVHLGYNYQLEDEDDNGAPTEDVLDYNFGFERDTGNFVWGMLISHTDIDDDDVKFSLTLSKAL